MLGHQGRGGVVDNAKLPTVKLTSVLVLGSVLCWSPYCVYIRIEVGWIDKPIGENVDFLLENLLWGLALTNNCLNPFLAWHLHFHGIVMAGERSASLTNFISNRKHGSTTSEAITLKG